MEEKERSSKEPWLAAVLSTFLAGIGQIYVGKLGRGCLLVLVEAILYFAAIWSWLSVNCNILVTAALFLTIAAFRIWNLFDAHKCARKANPDWFESDRKLGKDPWLALFLSDLIPGLGHLYIRKWVWGIVFTVVTLNLLITGRIYPLQSPAIWAIFTAFVCFHSYMMTPLRREKSMNMIVIISVAIVCSHLLGGYTPYYFKTYIVESFQLPTYEELSYFLPTGKISGGSMTPTLKAGDRFLVRKTGKYIPKRGDVVVFKPPNDMKDLYVERIVALSGETVEIKDGALYVNGREVQKVDFIMDKYPENTFGIEQPYKVPDDSVFLLGDSSANSEDSRFFGAVLQKDIIGKAYKIYWPLSRRGPIK